MKVSREARIDVQEWMAQAAEEAAEAEAERKEIDRVGYETLEHDYAQETQSIRNEIIVRAQSEHWSADRWRKAMQDTYRFSDEELEVEYQSRMDDDDDYNGALYETYGFGHLVG